MKNFPTHLGINGLTFLFFSANDCHKNGQILISAANFEQISSFFSFLHRAWQQSELLRTGWQRTCDFGFAMWTNWGGKGGGELAGQTGRGGNWVAGNTGQRAGYRQAGGKSGEIGDRIDQAGGMGVTGRELSTVRKHQCNFKGP